MEAISEPNQALAHIVGGYVFPKGKVGPCVKDMAAEICKGRKAISPRTATHSVNIWA